MDNDENIRKMLAEGVLNKPISVTRKDGSVREVYIIKDEATDKFCFVNMTTFHVCKCRFDTPELAFEDLCNNSFVKHFDFQ